MHSYIYLGLGNFEVDWTKTHGQQDHAILFRRSDLCNAAYIIGEDEQTTRPAYARPVGSILPRLELLGYTLTGCRRKFDADVDDWPSHLETPSFSFDELAEFLRTVDIDAVATPYADPREFDFGEFVRRSLFEGDAFSNIALVKRLTEDDGQFLENLDPYIVIRLLGENHRNLGRHLIWRSADFADESGITDDEFAWDVPPEKRFMLVTEGSSDTNVLRKALGVVAPGVQDFFDFVDMGASYPFTGVGNVVNFCRGLARIHVLNNILAILDNDTAGRAAFQELQRSRLPSNIQVMVLPDLDICREVSTIGPSGVLPANINGRAVSIELFLDLRSMEQVQVRWTAFDSRLGEYQGALIGKDQVVKTFLETDVRSGGYDMTKLELLWEEIIRLCTSTGG